MKPFEVRLLLACLILRQNGVLKEPQTEQMTKEIEK